MYYRSCYCTSLDKYHIRSVEFCVTRLLFGAKCENERGSWMPHLIRNISYFLMVKYAMLVVNKIYFTLNILTANLKHLPCPSPHCKDSIWNSFEKNNRSAHNISVKERHYLLKWIAACLNCKFGEIHQKWRRNAENLEKCFFLWRRRRSGRKM